MIYDANEWDNRPHKSDDFRLIRPDVNKLIPLVSFPTYASAGIYLILATEQGSIGDESQIKLVRPQFSTAILYN